MSNLSEGLNKLRIHYNNHLWRGRLILTVLIILIVMVVVRVSLPYTIVYSAVYWLGQQGIASQIEDIDIDVTRGTFAILNASGNKDGKKVFNIGRASIDWQWRPLSRKTIHIKEVILEDFDLEASQYTDAVVIAGVVIRQTGTLEQQPVEDEQGVAWGTALDRIDFRDLAFCFQQYDGAYDSSATQRVIDYCGNIDHISWQGIFGLGNTATQAGQPSAGLSADGTLQIKHLNMHNKLLDGTLINAAEIELTEIGIDGIDDINLEQISVVKFALLQDGGHSRHKHAVEFDRLGISGISLKDTRSLELKTLTLKKPVVSVARDNSGTWKHEQWLPQPVKSLDTEQPDAQATTTSPAIFSVKLGSVSVSETEACFQQAEPKVKGKLQAIDYCVTLDNTEWKGNASIITPSDEQGVIFDISGDLELAKLRVSNNRLKRDLLAFQTLAVSTISIKASNDLAFDKLDLDNVEGLELTNTDSGHTVSVASIDIAAFIYRNNVLAIDSLAVSELGMNVAQNKDGSLDYEQWLIKTAGEETEKTQETEPLASEPVRIKIGELSLDTSRMVQFTDQSVSPEMQIGFKEIHFKIKNLDSGKPKQESPLELSAKTARHGTVELKGVVKPFEAKPSFDANGKLAGIDLRVASPKAEQAIGHIIKSGQLNADLKLLSEQGQLDSKISLILHHFNLKAKSKKDAAALDEIFGMPINQSLVLLKDKKDRIKLDIPITGDINNPDFDPKDAIIKATAKATTVTLITFYTPYGLAFAGGNVLFNLATAMNFDPLLFDAGSSQITEANKQQLGKLTELLVERPHVHLTLCGFTNLNDRDKMFTEIVDPKNIKPVSAERRVKLKQLGSDRQESVKNHLISVGKISHDRLILCEPEHNDDTESLAGVEISI